MKVLDLFSGIGGFALGFEKAGFSPGAFVEIEPFCQRILRKHWPSVPIYPDIRQVTVAPGSFPIFTGGFPCQDVSVAQGCEIASLLGDRSGLWYEYLRLIQEGRPRWVVIENVKQLQNRGLLIILRQLAKLGYDAEWHTIRACDVGLPHIRQRIWIIAHLVQDGVPGHQPFPIQGLRRVPWVENGRRAQDWERRPNFPASRLCRGSNGIPAYMDRIAALGNAVVPGIPYLIARSIAIAEESFNDNA